MKAAVSKGQRLGLRIDEVPDPVPEAEEVVVRVDRVGICGSDLHAAYAEGDAAPEGAILGHEFCGEVVAVGAAVDWLRPGDRVAPMPFRGCGRCVHCLSGRPHHCPEGRMDVLSGFAQYSRAGARECVRLPPEVGDDDGALIEPLAVGLQAVRKAQLPIGARVLVTGAGPIGALTAYWARRLGAGPIAVMARSARREPIARALGATHFIAQQDVANPQEAVCDALGGAPDVVFEAVGVPGAIAAALGFVKPLGTVVSLGFCSGQDSFVPVVPLMKEVRLLFSVCYERADYQYIVDLLAAGERGPRAIVTDRVGLDAMPAKFAALHDGTAPDCKVLVHPWPVGPRPASQNALAP